MKAMVAMTLVALSGATYASKDAEVTDPRAIQAFYADPQTHAYNMQDPKGWVSYRKLILLGKRQPNGSCKYPLTVSTTGNYASFATEIAVNQVRCQSLILEGNPGSAPRRPAQTAMPANAKPQLKAASLAQANARTNARTNAPMNALANTLANAQARAAIASTEITDAKAIQAFLADPQTHAYNMRDPKGWAWYRKIIQVGTRQPNGACRYPAMISTTGSYASFATEIAVNHLRCQSLVLEGNPASPSIKPVQGVPNRNPRPPPNMQARAGAQLRHP